MITLTPKEILEELLKLGIDSEDDLNIFYREYTLYLHSEYLKSPS